MNFVDEIEVLRVAGNKLTDDRADDGDLLPALAERDERRVVLLTGWPPRPRY
jgi:hypothetical protein